MRYVLPALQVSLLLSLAGCGPATPPPAEVAPPPAPTSDPMLRPVTQAQVKVAHYATADGMHGLVLDRTGEKPKFRMDGAKDIVELTPEEDRFAGTLRGHFLLMPDGRRPLYISAGGGIKLFLGRDEFPLNSDKPAEPLPAATVTGTPVKEPPAYEATVARLTPISVRKKFPQYKQEDAANLAKIGEVIAQATADMFVHFVAHGSTWHPSFRIVPEAFSGVVYGGVGHRTDEPWDPKKPGLPGHGGKNHGFSEYNSQGNHMNVVHLKGYPGPFPEAMPGIIWEVDNVHVVFVSLDGVRYTLNVNEGDKGPTFESGAGPEAKWPAPGFHGLLDVHIVSSLAKAGAMPQKVADELTALDDAWNTCAQKAWKGAQRQIDSNKFTEADRKDWVKKVEVACDAHVKKQEARILQLTDERQKERKALFEKAKARVVAVGANK